MKIRRRIYPSAIDARNGAASAMMQEWWFWPFTAFYFLGPPVFVVALFRLVEGIWIWNVR